MICCLESPFTDAKSTYYSQVATDEKLLDKESSKKTSGGSAYPGMRRTPHGPPADHPIPNAQIANSNNNSNYNNNPANNKSNNGLISVTVPPGVLPGQEIHVRRPDGKDGLVEAVVPPGMTEGSIFYVKAPEVESSTNPQPQPLQSQQQQQQYQPPVDANAPSSAPSPAPKGDFANCLDNDAKPSIV